MRKIKLNGQNINISSSGNSLLIYPDTFRGADLFRDASLFLFGVANKELPNGTLMTQLMYTFIKTADASVYPTYKAMIDSLHDLKYMTDPEVVGAVFDECCEMLGYTGDDSVAEPENDKKKETTAGK